jgi:hypothetical protein
LTSGIMGGVALSWPMRRLLNSQKGSLIASKTKARCVEPGRESKLKLSMAIPRIARPRCCDLTEDRCLVMSNSWAISSLEGVRVQILTATNLFADFVHRLLEACVSSVRGGKPDGSRMFTSCDRAQARRWMMCPSRAWSLAQTDLPKCRPGLQGRNLLADSLAHFPHPRGRRVEVLRSPHWGATPLTSHAIARKASRRTIVSKLLGSMGKKGG